MDSQYTRENTQVLGVETVEEEEIEEETKNFFDTYRVVDIFAVFGGIILVALFAYIAYSGKEGK